MDKIKFGIIGLGMMGEIHLKNIISNPYAEVIAVCARTKSKVEEAQRKYDIKYGYTDTDDMMANPEIDAVVIASGAGAHKSRVFGGMPLEKTYFL
ncbi:MAG TPA: Gfo/Idh/MocA family oxidoreductase [Candidatus Alectryocaccobium stercorigallinarum]|nr:Gfo/Idh/MocA family oxidoreductase [Candidatus Alectryocaccobium stercorigallinarum]